MSYYIDFEYIFSDYYVYKIYIVLQFFKIIVFFIFVNLRKKNNIVLLKCERIVYCRVYNYKFLGKKKCYMEK